MNKMKTAVLALALTGCVTSRAVYGEGEVRNRVERAQDRKELRQDARQRLDDRMDVAKLEKALADFDQARAANQAAAMAGVDSHVMTLARQERAESGVEVAQKAAEVRRDGAEVRSDRREVVRDVRTGHTGGQLADDARDLRDDRRDRRDDRRDLGHELGAAGRRGDIAVEYKTLSGRMDAPSLDRRRALLVELIGIARAELAGDRQETREDRRERREDRRETREDRRENARTP